MIEIECRVENREAASGKQEEHMMNIERRHGSDKPVIEKYLLDLQGNPFRTFASTRDEYAVTDHFVYPGPIQYFGPSVITDSCTKTLALEKQQLLVPHVYTTSGRFFGCYEWIQEWNPQAFSKS